MDQARMSDTIEIEQLLAKYATGMTRDDVESVMEVFTADGWYAAFGDKYLARRLPHASSPRPPEGSLHDRHSGARVRR